MTENCFVYGSLLADEVVQILLDRIPRNEPATIRGYTRRSVKRRSYPATIKAASSESVFGRVLFDLTKEEMTILDDFEDTAYYKEVVEAELQGGGTATASVYIWHDGGRDQLYGQWSYEDFRENHLAAFMEMVKEYASSADFPHEEAEIDA